MEKFNNIEKIGNKEIQGETTWKSPSNIALVKYWGKYGRQMPANASVSFTLENAYSKTTMKYKNGSGKVTLFFEGEKNEAFGEKIEKFMESVKDIIPFYQELDYEISSTNSFPHSAGIASSASAMSALCMGLCKIENTIFGTLTDKDTFLQKASYLSRLASGSASRSIYPKLGQWGEHAGIEGSSNLYAIDVHDRVDPIFHTYKNSILIASSAVKEVSSTLGHKMMNENPYAAVRFTQANENLQKLMDAMKRGDLDTFMQIVELEALTLHALMMTSNPSFILLQPSTIVMIDRIRKFRKASGLPVCFTLDAGPNIHLLYPEKIATEVQKFVQKELLELCENGVIIEDEVGNGSKEIMN